MRKALTISTALALLAAPVHAQGTGAPPTTITPDTLLQLSTGTTATTEGTVTTIGGGVRAGDNLFHSFARFNLGPGGSAPAQSAAKPQANASKTVTAAASPPLG